MSRRSVLAVWTVALLAAVCSGEYCSSYVDSIGDLQPGVDCPSSYCCGTCDNRYCCSSPSSRLNQTACPPGEKCKAFTDATMSHYPARECGSGEYCCGACVYRYCCSYSSLRLDQSDCLGSLTISDVAGIVAGLVIFLAVVSVLVWFVRARRRVTTMVHTGPIMTSTTGLIGSEVTSSFPYSQHSSPPPAYEPPPYSK